MKFRVLFVATILNALVSSTSSVSAFELQVYNNPFNNPEHAYFMGLTDQRPDGVFLVGCSEQYSRFVAPEQLVHLTGGIEVGDDRKLIDFLEGFETNSTRCGPVVLSLDLTGGELSTAINIGRYLKQRDVPTVVLPRRSCLSACVYVFAGGFSSRDTGTIIFEGAELGMHFPRGGDPLNYANALRFNLEVDPEGGLQEIRENAQNVRNQSFAYFARDIGQDRYYDLLLSSPIGADEYWYIDSYSEMRLLNIGFFQARDSVIERPVTLDADFGLEVCATHLLESGITQPFTPRSVALIGDSIMVSIGETPSFCFITMAPGVDNTDTHFCRFDGGDLRSLLQNNRGTVMEPWVSVTGGWWPPDMFSNTDLLPRIGTENGLTPSDFEFFFRELMFGRVNGHALQGRFCDATDSISSISVVGTQNSFVFDASCPSGLGYCKDK